MDRIRASSLMVTAAIFAGAALVSTGAIAQQQDARPPQRTIQRDRPLTEQEVRPQFGAAVNRVLVDVTVFDEDGRFVPDLTIDDFEVLEEGKVVDLSARAVP